MNSIKENKKTDPGSTADVRDYYQNDRRNMLKYIRAGVKTTLEFGCGCGNFSRLIKDKYNAECWGVEIDAKAAQKASAILDKVINVDAHQAIDLLPDNYFDCIIFNDVLEHFADPYSLLTKIKSKLKDNAEVVASIPNVRFWRILKALVLQGRWDYTDSGILDRTHLRFFTYNSLVKMFDELDYELLTIEGIKPTASKSFKIVNAIFFNKLKDAKFRQFACVAKPKLPQDK